MGFVQKVKSWATLGLEKTSPGPLSNLTLWLDSLLVTAVVRAVAFCNIWTIILKNYRLALKQNEAKRCILYFFFYRFFFLQPI